MFFLQHIITEIILTQSQEINGSILLKSKHRLPTMLSYNMVLHIHLQEILRKQAACEPKPLEDLLLPSSDDVFKIQMEKALVSVHITWAVGSLK